MKNIFLITFLLCCIKVTFGQNVSFQNVYQIGYGGGDDEVRSIKTDSAGNVYVAGTFQNGIDVDPGPSTYNLKAARATDIFLIKYSSLGVLVWAKKIGGNAEDLVTSMEIDSLGNLYLAGTFNGTIDFDPSPSVTNLTPLGSRDGFLAKYDKNGSLIWAKQISGGQVTINQIYRADNRLYIAGTYTGTVDFDPSVATATITATGNDAFFAKYDLGGNYVLAKSTSGSQNEIGTTICTDLSGNIYFAGQFSGSVDFDPSLAVYTLTTTTSTAHVFLCRYDSLGNFKWAKQIGGGSFTSRDVSCLKTNLTDGFYITGTNSGLTDFDPSPLVANLSTAGGPDIYLAKYDTLGNYEWAFRCGGTGSDIPYTMNIRPSGKICLTGNFAGTVDFDPSPSTATLVAPNTDVFMAEYDSTGNYINAKNFGGSSSTDYGYNSTLDKNGNMLIGGYFTPGPIDMDPSATTFTLANLQGNSFFAGKYDSLFNFTWGIASQDQNGGGDEDAYKIRKDAAGNFFVMGSYANITDIAVTDSISLLYTPASFFKDVFIAKYDPSFNLTWVRSITSTTYIAGKSLTVDASGNIIVTGIADYDIDFNSVSPGTNTLSMIGNVFLAKYDNNGNYLWANQLASNISTGRDVTTDPSGNVYITGNFSGVSDFDPSPASAILNPTSSGSYDIFIAKYDPGGNYIWAKSIGGGNLSFVKSGNALVVDAGGNLIVAGNFSGTTDFDPSASVANLVTFGNLDVFIASYSSAGNYNWAVKVGSPNPENVNAVKIDGAGDIIIAGEFGNGCDFDPSASNAVITAFGGVDAFLAKYTSTGAYIWAKSISGGTGTELLLDACIDGNNDLYFCGVQSSWAIITKYTAAGNPVWTYSVVGYPKVKSLVNSGFGIYATGAFTGITFFDPFAALNFSSLLYPTFGDDGFILKLNTCVSPTVSLTAPIYNVCTSSTGGSSMPLTGSPTGGTYSGIGVVGSSFTAQPTAGSYSVTYSYTNSTTGCSNSTTSVITVASCLEVGEISLENENINVYPNPASGYLFINAMAGIKMEVYNSVGELIHSQVLTEQNNLLNISDYASGVYLFMFKLDEKTVSRKIIKSE